METAGVAKKTVDVLKKSDVFGHMSDESLAELAKLCRTEEFEAGTIIFRQDTTSADVYVIEDGLVSIMLELGPTDRRQIQAVSDYGCFSWTAVVPPFHHVCTAKTLEKTKLLVFDGKQLRGLVNTNPKLCAEILAGIASVASVKLRMAFTQLMGVTYQD
jgi:CRP-like cAMP-binding protein